MGRAGIISDHTMTAANRLIIVVALFMLLKLKQVNYAPAMFYNGIEWNSVKILVKVPEYYVEGPGNK